MERTIVANLRNIFTRYRWIIYLILLTIAIPTVRHIVVWYKSRPPNHLYAQDIEWPDMLKGPNTITYHKWRYFLKARSRLPLKIETYSKTDPNGDFILEKTIVILYPNDEKGWKTFMDSLMPDLPKDRESYKLKPVDLSLTAK